MKPYSDKQQREIFHFLFLERLLRISDPSFYVLKGGVNLRFFFNSPRYSEDMDLDVHGGSVETLKKNGYRILEDKAFRRSLQVFGIEDLVINDPSKAKQTSTTQRFRCRLVNQVGESFPTKVEFSRRSFSKEQLKEQLVVKEVIQPSIAAGYKKLSFSCQHYAPEIAVAQKVQALGGRLETQARDVFDLYVFYLSHGLGKEALWKHTTPQQREDALAALISLDYTAYQGQVVEYLESTAQDTYSSRKAWEQMCSIVAEVLDDST